MKCKKMELQKAIHAVRAGISIKEDVVQATFLRFGGGSVFSNNGQVAVSHPLPESCLWEGAVHFAEFTELLEKVESDELDITQSEGLLVISTAQTRYEFRTVTGEGTQPPARDVKKWSKLPPSFWGAALRSCSCVGDSITRPFMNFVHAYKKQVEATDGQRVFVHQLEHEFPDEMLILGKAIRDLSKHDCNLVGATQGWNHFRNKAGAVFSTRTLSTEKGSAMFPDLKAVLNVTGETVAFPESILHAVRRCSAAFNPGVTAPCISVEARNGKLQLCAEGDHVTVKERMLVPWKVPLAFLISSSLFEEVVASGVGCCVGEKSVKMADTKNQWEFVAALYVAGV